MVEAIHELPLRSSAFHLKLTLVTDVRPQCLRPLRDIHLASFGNRLQTGCLFYKLQITGNMSVLQVADYRQDACSTILA